MFFTKSNKINEKKEKGASDIVQTLLMLPISIMLILAMIDVGLFFSARTTVQNMTRDAVRQVAMSGGVDTRLSNYDVEAALSRAIYDPSGKSGEKCAFIGCSTTAPEVDCYVVGADGKHVSQATQAGQDVACEVKYKYSPISFFMGTNDNFLNHEYTIVEHARSETGFR